MASSSLCLLSASLHCSNSLLTLSLLSSSMLFSSSKTLVIQLVVYDSQTVTYYQIVSTHLMGNALHSSVMLISEVQSAHETCEERGQDNLQIPYIVQWAPILHRSAQDHMEAHRSQAHRKHITAYGIVFIENFWSHVRESASSCFHVLLVRSLGF